VDIEVTIEEILGVRGRGGRFKRGGGLRIGLKGRRIGGIYLWTWRSLCLFFGKGDFWVIFNRIYS